ncbi:hypothetical protein Y1Q_0023948 [Alligator mississippiensis]|uniref:Uncharacterized protein n=1 Tax=Alligator mississippiensis TaxID=8496 RepID=A0A151MM42_ALLMI|nr:hypothetical protein Y1Q_0023948 [Alligator mississippiensis]
MSEMHRWSDSGRIRAGDEWEEKENENMDQSVAMVKLQAILGPLKLDLDEALKLESQEREKPVVWQEVKSILARSETRKLEKAEPISIDLRDVYKIPEHCLDIRKMLMRFGVKNRVN